MGSPDWLVHGGMAADKRGLEENHPNMVKDKRGKPTASIALKSERRGLFCLEKGQDATHCAIARTLARASRQEKQTKGGRVGIHKGIMGWHDLSVENSRKNSQRILREPASQHEELYMKASR